MADNRKLAQGLMMMTPSARADLAQREEDVQRGKTVELLRRAGKEMYDNPIVNTAIGFTPVLGDVQAAGETMAALNRGAPWQETAGYAAGMLPFVPMIGKTVWHGSPHTFDKFDLSKIGTGEGAQSYGHGLYLAEAPTTAETYKTAGTFQHPQISIDGTPYVASSVLNNATPYNLAADAYSRFGNKNDAISWLDDFGDSLKARKILEKAKNIEDVTSKQGNLYKVDLPDEQIAKMLDWDKPINQQPEVMNLLGIDADKAALYEKTKQQRLSMPAQFDIDIPAEKAMYDEAIALQRQMDEIGLEKSGKKYYEDLIKKYGSYKGISDALREQGLSGIKYYDAGSRSKAQNIEDATRNYVVFSDEIPQILERNGQPVAQALRDYRGSHTAPGPEFGAQLHDVTGGGAMYPEDIYSARGAHIYGMGGPDVAMDKETMRIIHNMRNKPEEMVDIYRAVPNQADISAINAGDWITINPNYAKMHGESNLPEGYKILQQKVPAKSVWTNADSIHEYGYWPE